MKRRTFIQSVAAVFGAAAAARHVEPEAFIGFDPAGGIEETVVCVRTNEHFTLDESLAKLWHENIERRTYAAMKGFA